MELFKQIRKVKIKDIVIDYEDLDIEFSIKQADDTDDKGSDIAIITIYNLSELTKSKINKDELVTVTAGYKENNSVIFNGVVDEVVHMRTDNDIATIITCTPNNFLYTNTIVNEQFQKNISAREILQLISKKIPFNIDIKDLKKNVVYPNGKAFSNRLSNVIDIIARDTNCIAKLSNNTIEFKRKDRQYTTVIDLRAENGLITVQKQKEKKENGEETETEKYIVETLLIPQVKLGQLLNIQSTFYNGKLVVKSLEYKAKSVNDFSIIAVCEVVK